MTNGRVLVYAPYSVFIVASGTYLYRLDVGGRVRTQRMTVLR